MWGSATVVSHLPDPKRNGATKCLLFALFWVHKPEELGRCKAKMTYHPGGHTVTKASRDIIVAPSHARYLQIVPFQFFLKDGIERLHTDDIYLWVQEYVTMTAYVWVILYWNFFSFLFESMTHSTLLWPIPLSPFYHCKSRWVVLYSGYFGCRQFVETGYEGFILALETNCISNLRSRLYVLQPLLSETHWQWLEHLLGSTSKLW